jgi:hypothetical protein
MPYDLPPSLYKSTQFTLMVLFHILCRLEGSDGEESVAMSFIEGVHTGHGGGLAALSNL